MNESDKTLRDRIFGLITAERNKQDMKWGGFIHDNEHTVNDWIAILSSEVGQLLGLNCFKGTDTKLTDYDVQLLKIAAVAVAAIEAHEKHDAGVRTRMKEKMDKEIGLGPIKIEVIKTHIPSESKGK